MCREEMVNKSVIFLYAKQPDIWGKSLPYDILQNPRTRSTMCNLANLLTSNASILLSLSFMESLQLLFAAVL